MSTTAVLLCGRTGVDLESISGRPVAAVESLCTRPDVAARTLRRLGATRVVLGLCEPPSHDLLAALRHAGAEPFGVETVLLGGAPAAAVIAAATARLDALPPNEHGRPRLVAAGISRRALLSRNGILGHAPVAVLDARACSGTARCGLCAEACPERAIDGRAAVPEIDVNACNACAACITACPGGALHLAGTSTAQVEAQLRHLLSVAAGVVFACADADVADLPPGWARVELPTLALVSVGWILQLRSRGVGARFAPCEHCRNHATTVEAFAAQLLAHPTLGSDQAGPLRLTEPAATVDAIVSLAAPPPTTKVRGTASPLGFLSLDPDRCTLCGACANLCPTGALRLAETGARTTLEHLPAACIACGRCTGVCPETALGLERAIDLERLERREVDLLAARRESCSGCGEPLPPQALRLRLRRLLPDLAASPLDLCARCAASAAETPAEASTTIGRVPPTTARKEGPAWKTHEAS